VGATTTKETLINQGSHSTAKARGTRTPALTREIKEAIADMEAEFNRKWEIKEAKASREIEQIANKGSSIKTTTRTKTQEEIIKVKDTMTMKATAGINKGQEAEAKVDKGGISKWWDRIKDTKWLINHKEDRKVIRGKASKCKE